jgi:hypothetical protein
MEEYRTSHVIIRLAVYLQVYMLPRKAPDVLFPNIHSHTNAHTNYATEMPHNASRAVHLIGISE